MKELIYHVSPKRLIKRIKVNEEGYISFSKGEFASGFGNWVYVFEFEKIKKLLTKFKGDKGCFETITECEDNRYSTRCNKLKSEYRAYSDIELDDYCIGVAKHFNESEGVVENILIEEIIKEKEL